MSYDSICCFRNSDSSCYRLLWEITNRCNQSCKFCHSKSDQELTVNDAKIILDNISEIPLKDIILTGGEPLLNRNLFFIMDEIKKRDISIDLCTNATLVDDYIASELKKYLSEVSISLDTVNTTTYTRLRGSNSLENVYLGIKKLVENKLEVHLTCVVNRLNMNELDEIAKRAEALGVASVSYLKMISSIASNIDFSHRVELDSFESKRCLDRINNIRSTSKLNINTKRFVEMSDKCLAGKNILGLRSDGRLIKCIMDYSNEVVNAKERRINKDMLLHLFSHTNCGCVI